MHQGGGEEGLKVKINMARSCSWFDDGRRIEIDPSSPHIFIDSECYCIELETQTALKEFEKFIFALKDENF